MYTDLSKPEQVFNYLIGSLKRHANWSSMILYYFPYAEVQCRSK